MDKFTFYNPTKIIFGIDTIATLSEHLPIGANIMLLYGGGSIKRNGIYEQVKKSLANFTHVEFAGVEPNPRYETLMKAVELGRAENVNFILAVGGGSVLDAAKFIAIAIPYQNGDPWEILVKRLGSTITAAVPIGTVLTLPATGSEMNANSVISRESTREKLAFSSLACFPVFSILDPRVVSSLPQRQIANGIVDAFTHVMEQYLTYPADAPLQDRFAESILQTLIEVGPKVYANPNDLTAAGNFMWCTTMALNGLIGKGVPNDWATHNIGHELTALFGIDHARTLAIIAPNLYRVLFAFKKEKLAQYATRVWNITEGSNEERAQAAISRTVEFFHSLGIQTKLSDYTSDYAGTAEEIVSRFTRRNWLKLGENGNVTIERVKEIVEMSY
ncbi:MAG: iron-containing alcohol dehydrogenase [Cytophagales bacterium]|nr:iron-containing alcohol dehydrogenase [Bernardetiaceae bacterium]MDW8205983.1 iron-containing alcohol dehydrogenase [Cytophagales bacterium]